MEIFLNILLLVIGFALLVKGADLFVDGSVGISRKLKIPAVVVGLTIVAFGTSAPEASVSIAAAINGSNGIAVGNVIGSNMFNLLVVTGLSAIFMALPVSGEILRRDYPFMLLITAVMLGMFLLVTPNDLSRWDGVALLALFAFFLAYTVIGAMKSRHGEPEPDGEVPKLWKSLLISVIGIAAIVLGGDLVVDNASDLALACGMSQVLVGLTIVACGTSLPELVTSVVASKKGENDIAIGNVVGSNIFNILLVLGASATIRPISLGADAVSVITDAVILLAVCVVFAIPMYKNKKLGRVSGALMALTYAAYLAYIIMRNYGLV